MQSAHQTTTPGNDALADGAGAASWPSGRAQAASIYAACMAGAVFLTLPVILGLLAELRAFSPSQLAVVASAETLGLALTALLGPWLLKRFSARRLMAVGLALLAAIDLVSALEWSFEAFVAARIGASIAGGLVMPAAIAVIGSARVPERSFSLTVSAQILTSVIGLYALALLGAAFGLPGLYGALAVLAAVASVLVAICDMPAMAAESAVATTQIARSALAMIASILFFFCALGVYWAFIERAGKEYGIALDDLSVLIAASNLAALFGSLSAPWFTRKYGDRAVLLAGLCLTVVLPLAFLWPVGGAIAYSANLSLFVVLWNLLMVVQMAAVSRLDPDGRAISLTPAAQGFGLSLGPLLTGPVAENFGFASAVASSGAFALIGLLVTWLAFRGGQGHGRAPV